MTDKPAAFSPALRPPVRTMKPYVPGKPVEEVQRELGLSQVIKLASNENPLGPSPKAVAAAAEALARAHLYPEATAPLLRQAIAQRWQVPEDWVLVGNGTDEVFRLVGETYLDPGDRVVVPAPGFSVYTLVAELMGAEVAPVPCQDGVPDLWAMAAACQSRDGQAPAKVAWLCRPNNPTGGVFAAADLDAFLATVPADTLVVLDEAYQEYDTTGFSSQAYLLQHPNLMVTHTFSKIYGMAGLRLGYALARPEILAPLFTVRDPFSVNIPAQAAGVAALGDNDFVAHSRTVNAEGKAYLYAALRELGLRYLPTEANFILIDLGRPAAPVHQALLRKGIIIRPCASFGLPEHIRVTIGLPEQNQRFIGALADVLAQ